MIIHFDFNNGTQVLYSPHWLHIPRKGEYVSIEIESLIYEGVVSEVKYSKRDSEKVEVLVSLQGFVI